MFESFVALVALFSLGIFLAHAVEAWRARRGPRPSLWRELPTAGGGCAADRRQA